MTQSIPSPYGVLTDERIDLAADEVGAITGERLRWFARAIERAVLAAQAAQPVATHEHLKSGGKYRKLGEGLLQTDEPISDMEPVVVYQGEDGRLWVRPVSEFGDVTRFKALAARPSREWYARMIAESEGMDDNLPCGALYAAPAAPPQEPAHQPTMSDELRQKLRTASVVLGGLPELPGYNGSILQIDDAEAARIAKDIDDVVAALSADSAQTVARPAFAPPEELEAAVIDAAMNLAGQAKAHAFTLPVPHTTPRLYVALFEEGSLPPGRPSPPQANEPAPALEVGPTDAANWVNALIEDARHLQRCANHLTSTNKLMGDEVRKVAYRIERAADAAWKGQP